jgi:hypothetical protein
MSLFRIAARIAFAQPLSERYDYGTGPDEALPRGECKCGPGGECGPECKCATAAGPLYKRVYLSWMEPEDGSDSSAVLGLTEPEWRLAEEAMQWVQTKIGSEWGNTIAEVYFEPTGEPALSDEVYLGKDALQYLADNVRYSTGEDIYSEDCPAFSQSGILRS